MTDVCNRCLVIVDSRASVRGQTPRDDGLIDFTHPDCATDPISLKKWAERVLQLGGTIVTNQWANTFAPISTWHGDPVCSVHLWHLVDAEQKRGYR